MGAHVLMDRLDSSRSWWGRLGHVLSVRRRARGSRPLDLALLQLAGCVLLLVIIELVLLAGNTTFPFLILASFPVVGLVYLAAGLLAWRRRPANRMGPLMAIGSVIYVLTGLANVDVAGLIALGQIVATVPLALIVHLLLAFPSGRLRGRWDRAVVITAYVVCLPLQLPVNLFTPQPPPYDVLFVADRPDLLVLAHLVQPALGALVMIATAIILGRRLRSSTEAQRRVLIPLGAYGIIAVLMLPVGGSLLRYLGVDTLTSVIVQVVIMAGVPVAFALSVLRGGFARTVELDELTSWLSSGAPDRPRIAAAVGQAIGDPTVTVGYTVDGGPPVDARGERVTLRSGARGYVDVRLEGRPVATISYDAELITDPEHVAEAGRIVAIQLDRERLTAELLAGRQQLAESRIRIVTEADRERRRIAQDLHDGMQAELVVLALIAGRIAADEGAPAEDLRRQVDGLRREIDTTAADLRRLVHGLMPAILVERGLYVAARAFVDVLPIQTDLVVRGSDKGLPEVVETTGYFVLAEALTNAVRYAEAGHISVSLDRTEQWLQVEVSDDGIGGARAGDRARRVDGDQLLDGRDRESDGLRGSVGLQGLTDRVAVLGGRLIVDSPPGSGTRVLAEIPCVP